MAELNLQIEKAIDAVIFDCDSTLSSVEGITELAKMHDVFEAVHALTEEAMAKTGMNQALYHQRLELVKPIKSEMAKIADIYLRERTEDIQAVINTLQALGKPVYVLSAGIQETVELFVAHFNIPATNVFAVPVYFNEGGTYQGFDEKSPLASSTGKSQIVNQLKVKHPRISLIGDGMNDVEAATSVDRFIGYGGSHYRQGIAELSPFYIKSKSMSPVLPLVLTAQESDSLSGVEAKLFERGKALIQQQQVEIRDI